MALLVALPALAAPPPIGRATYSDGMHTLRLTPATSEGPETCVYVELVQRGLEEAPLIQQVWTIADDSSGKATVFTFPPSHNERAWPSAADLALGLWAAPDRFPTINLDRMIPMGVAEIRIGENGDFLLSTPQPLILHRGPARTTTLTVQGGDAATWTQSIVGANGEIISEADLALNRVDEFVRIETTPDGLVIIDLRPGSGAELEAGDTALVDYRIFNSDGQLVDSTTLPDRQTVHLQPAPGDYFEGFRQGVLGMRGSPRRPDKSERHFRRLVVPAALAFGSRGAPPLIGPDEPLIVDLELNTFRDNTR